MGEKVVKPDILDTHAKRITDNLVPYIEDAYSGLEPAKLGEEAMGMWGKGDVESHNSMYEHHRDNLKKGKGILEGLSQALKTTADNWRESDKPWVVEE